MKVLYLDVRALFTSISVPVVLGVINRKSTECINQAGMDSFLGHTCFIPKDKVISILEIVLNNYILSFQGKFYQQLQRTTMGSSVFPVITIIYMGYVEEIALDLECPYLPLGGKDIWMTLLA